MPREPGEQIPVRASFDVVPVRADGTFDLANTTSEDRWEDLIVFDESMTEQRFARVHVPRGTRVPIWVADTLRATSATSFAPLDLRSLATDEDDDALHFELVGEGAEGWEIIEGATLRRAASAAPLPPTSTLTIRARDPVGASASRTFSVLVNQPPRLRAELLAERIPLDAIPGTVVARISVEDDESLARYSGELLITCSPPCLSVQAPRLGTGGRSLEWDVIVGPALQRQVVSIDVDGTSFHDADGAPISGSDTAHMECEVFVPPRPPAIEVMAEETTFTARWSTGDLSIPLRITDVNEEDGEKISVRIDQISDVATGATVADRSAVEASRNKILIRRATMVELARAIEVATASSDGIWDRAARRALSMRVVAENSSGLSTATNIDFGLVVDSSVRQGKTKTVLVEVEGAFPRILIDDLVAFAARVADVRDPFGAAPRVTRESGDEEIAIEGRALVLRGDHTSFNGAVRLALDVRGCVSHLNLRLEARARPVWVGPQEIVLDTGSPDFPEFSLPLAPPARWVVSGDALARVVDGARVVLDVARVRADRSAIFFVEPPESAPLDSIKEITVPARVVSHPPTGLHLVVAGDGKRFPMHFSTGDLFERAASAPDRVHELHVDNRTDLVVQESGAGSISIPHPGPDFFPSEHVVVVRGTTAIGEDVFARIMLSLRNDRPAGIEVVVERATFAASTAGNSVIAREVARGIPQRGMPDAEGHTWELEVDVGDAPVRWDATRRLILIRDEGAGHPEAFEDRRHVVRIRATESTGRELQREIVLMHAFETLVPSPPAFIGADAFLEPVDYVSARGRREVEIALRAPHDAFPDVVPEITSSVDGALRAERRGGAWVGVLDLDVVRKAMDAGPLSSVRASVRCAHPSDKVGLSAPLEIEIPTRVSFDFCAEDGSLSHVVPVLSGRGARLDLFAMLVDDDAVFPSYLRDAEFWEFALEQPAPPEVDVDGAFLNIRAISSTVQIVVAARVRGADRWQRVPLTLRGVPRISAGAPDGNLGLIRDLGSTGALRAYRALRRDDSIALRKWRVGEARIADSGARFRRCQPRWDAMDMETLYGFFGQGVFVDGSAEVYIARDGAGCWYRSDTDGPFAFDPVPRVRDEAIAAAVRAVGEESKPATVEDSIFVVRRGEGRFEDSFAFGPLKIFARTDPPRRRSREAASRAVRAEGDRTISLLADDLWKPGDPVERWAVVGDTGAVAIDGDKLVLLAPAFDRADNTLTVRVTGTTRRFGQRAEPVELSIRTTNAATAFSVNGAPALDDAFVTKSFGAREFLIHATDAIGVRALELSVQGRVGGASEEEALVIETDGKQHVRIAQGARFEGQGATVLTTTDMFGSKTVFRFVWDVLRAREPPTPPTLIPTEPDGALFVRREGDGLGDISDIARNIACTNDADDINRVTRYAIASLRAGGAGATTATLQGIDLQPSDVGADGQFRFPRTDVAWSQLFSALRQHAGGVAPRRALVVARVVASDAQGDSVAYDVPFAVEFTVRVREAASIPRFRASSTRFAADVVVVAADVLRALRAHGDVILAQDDAMIEIESETDGVVVRGNRELCAVRAQDALGAGDRQVVLRVGPVAASHRRRIILSLTQTPALSRTPTFEPVLAREIFRPAERTVVVAFPLPLERHTQPYELQEARSADHPGATFEFDAQMDELRVMLPAEKIGGDALLAHVRVSVLLRGAEGFVDVQRAVRFDPPDLARVQKRFERRAGDATLRIAEAFAGAMGDPIERFVGATAAPLPCAVAGGGSAVRVVLDEEQSTQDWAVSVTLHARTAFGKPVPPVDALLVLFAPVRFTRPLRIVMSPIDPDEIALDLLQVVRASPLSRPALRFALGALRRVGDHGSATIAPAPELAGTAIRCANVVRRMHAEAALSRPRAFEAEVRVSHDTWSEDRVTLTVVAEARFSLEMPPLALPLVAVDHALPTVRARFGVGSLVDAAKRVSLDGQALRVFVRDGPGHVLADNKTLEVDGAGLVRLGVAGEGTDWTVDLPPVEVRRAPATAWDGGSVLDLERVAGEKLAIVRPFAEIAEDVAPPLRLAAPTKNTSEILRMGDTVHAALASCGCGLFEDVRGRYVVLAVDDMGSVFGASTSLPDMETSSASFTVSLAGRVVPRSVAELEEDEEEIAERNLDVVVGLGLVARRVTCRHALRPPRAAPPATLAFEASSLKGEALTVPLARWFETTDDSDPIEQVQPGAMAPYARLRVDMDARTVDIKLRPGTDAAVSAFDGRRFNVSLHARTTRNQHIASEQQLHLLPPLSVPRDRSVSHVVRVREHVPIPLDKNVRSYTDSEIERWEIVRGNQHDLFRVLPDKTLAINPTSSFPGRFDGRRWAETLVLRAHFNTAGRHPATCLVHLTNVVLQPSASRAARLQIYALPVPDRSTVTRTNPLGDAPRTLFVLGLHDAPDVPGRFEPRMHDMLSFSSAPHVTVDILIDRSALPCPIGADDFACMVADPNFTTFEEVDGGQAALLSCRISQDKMTECITRDARGVPTLHAMLAHLRINIAQDLVDALPGAISRVVVHANGKKITLGKVDEAPHNHVRSDAPLFDVEQRPDGTSRVHPREGAELLGFVAFE